jgi:hypothetical protein
LIGPEARVVIVLIGGLTLQKWGPLARPVFQHRSGRILGWDGTPGRGSRHVPTTRVLPRPVPGQSGECPDHRPRTARAGCPPSPPAGPAGRSCGPTAGPPLGPGDSRSRPISAEPPSHSTIRTGARREQGQPDQVARERAQVDQVPGQVGRYGGAHGSGSFLRMLPMARPGMLLDRAARAGCPGDLGRGLWQPHRVSQSVHRTTRHTPPRPHNGTQPDRRNTL